ncbi:DUF6776 family protein [Luteimonas vadosa]|uniref:Transmembrane protein n=1 Tax=Luteimonas vadosa TaxID=1165507 RepID=A0ABP9DU95_9GAMM
MTEPPTGPLPDAPADPRTGPASRDAAKTAVDHAGDVHHRGLYALLAVLLAALLFGGWGVWKTFAPGVDDPQGLVREQQATIDALEQRVATLARSDQISREANNDLQGTLAERDEEIAGLRADVAFYERFVGATGQRRGLAVHELKLQPQTDQAWHFVATLTQNLNRGAVSSGRLTLSVEGTVGGRLKRLSWSELRQQHDVPGAEYSFKYFQQVEGDIVLPPGFQPVRVHVRLAPARGPAVEQSFAWGEAVASAPQSAPDA